MATAAQAGSNESTGETICKDILSNATAALDACGTSKQLYREENEILKQQIKDSQRLAQQLQEDKNAWYRSPGLMIPLGVILGVVAAKKVIH